MRGLVLADLRASLRIWIGALLLLTVVQLATMWIGGAIAIGIANTTGASYAALLSEDLATNPATMEAILPIALTTVFATSLVVLTLVALVVVGNVIGSIVWQRRRIVALWQLSGMTDAQTRGVLRGQVAAMSVVAFLVAAVIAVATRSAFVGWLEGGGLLVPAMRTEAAFVGFALGGVLALLLCIVAVGRASRELREMQPLEALRAEGSRDRSISAVQWIVIAALAVAAVVMGVSALSTAKLSDAQQSALIAGVLGVAAVSTAGPVVIVGVVRAWTAVVPMRASVEWHLARRTLLASTGRLVSSVAPIAMAVHLLVGMLSASRVVEESTGAGGGPRTFDVQALVGLPLCISLTGAVVAVLMAGQQREREIQLAELAGATPAQQIRQAVSEAVITVVTGVGLGLLFASLATAASLPAVAATVGSATFAIAWEPLLAVTVVVLLATGLATVVPTVLAQAQRGRAFTR